MKLLEKLAKIARVGALGAGRVNPLIPTETYFKALTSIADIFSMNLPFPWREKYFLVVLLVILFSCLSGSPGQAFKDPEVELQKVRILQVGPEALLLEGDLEIFNPNEGKKSFSGYRYQLEVEGQRLMSGESDQPFEIPARGTALISIPATIRYDDLSALSQKELRAGNLVYILSGTVLLKTWIGTIPLPFSYRNSVNLPNLLREKAREFLQGL